MYLGVMRTWKGQLMKYIQTIRLGLVTFLLTVFTFVPANLGN